MSIRGRMLCLGFVCLDVVAVGCGSTVDNRFGSVASTSGAVTTGASASTGSSGSAGTGIGTNSTGPQLVVDDSGASTAPTDDGGLGGTNTLMMTIRDFMMSTKGGTNPDFENVVSDDRGIVETTLGSDQKPVYAHADGGTISTHGQMYFDQWYNDTAGVNINVQYPITLTQQDGGTFGYDSRVSGVALSAAQPMKQFFPIDDGTPYATTFGNQGQPHNYSFTTELHTVFTYHGGETFSFSGDDDVFVFINNQLVIDLGGVHVREQGSVQLDTLGLTTGQDYPLDLFGAERHTTQSNVSFETTLTLRPPPR